MSRSYTGPWRSAHLRRKRSRFMASRILKSARARGGEALGMALCAALGVIWAACLMAGA